MILKELEFKGKLYATKQELVQRVCDLKAGRILFKDAYFDVLDDIWRMSHLVNIQVRREFKWKE